MARPKKDENLKHGNRVYVRYSDVQYELLQGYAEDAGCPIATYVRDASLNNTPKIFYNITVNIPEIQKLTEEYRRIGINLNQIAAFFNMGGVRSKVMQDQISKCISELDDLRKKTLEMAGNHYGNLEALRK